VRRLDRSILAASAFAALTLVAGVARADPRAELEKGRAAYLARNWTEAEERLRVLVDPASGPKDRGIVSQARMYLGASLLSQGKKDAAADVFEKLVLEDPMFEPDPLSFPGEVVNTFIDTRAELAERIKNAAITAAKLESERKAREEAEREKQRIWFEKVKAQAQDEKITVRNSRLVASLPFGAGQFQNRQPVLGWTFLAVESALAIGTVITLPMYLYARDRESALRDVNDVRTADQWHERADDIQIANLGLAGAFAAVAVVGIVQANVAFTPEREERKTRELPPLARMRPVLAPLASGGGFVGVAGTAF